MNTTQSSIGTKETLRNWLRNIKNLTYTQYCKLTPEKKQQIQKEYKGRIMTSRSTVIVKKEHESSTDN